MLARTKLSLQGVRHSRSLIHSVHNNINLVVYLCAQNNIQIASRIQKNQKSIKAVYKFFPLILPNTNPNIKHPQRAAPPPHHSLFNYWTPIRSAGKSSSPNRTLDAGTIFLLPLLVAQCLGLSSYLRQLFLGGSYVFIHKHLLADCSPDSGVVVGSLRDRDVLSCCASVL